MTIDDQDHTHDLLKSGEALGCVTTLSQPMRGCVSEPLGQMRYRCLARPDLASRCHTPSGKVSVHRLLKLPAIIFNRKDALQDMFLLKYFGLVSPQYPKHYVPALDAFGQAIELGLGWGMVPDLISHMSQTTPTNNQEPPKWVEVMPNSPIDVALYWQHWEQTSQAATKLTQKVKEAARQRLLPVA